MARQKEKMQAQQPEAEESEDAEKQRNDRPAENNRRDLREPPDNRVGELRERLLKLERWGILPPKKVEEMLAAGDKDVPPEYREIISRYYKRIIDRESSRARR